MAIITKHIDTATFFEDSLGMFYTNAVKSFFHEHITQTHNIELKSLVFILCKGDILHDPRWRKTLGKFMKGIIFEL